MPVWLSLRVKPSSVKPRIGITSGTTSSAWSAGGASWQPYADAVARAGGDPVHLGPETFGREAGVLQELQGVLFSGGNDVDLAMFPNPPDSGGLTAEEMVRRYNLTPEPDRDRYELPLLQAVIERDLPLFGICRGCQVLNVGLGGRLILDIPSQVETSIRHPAYTDAGLPSSGHALEILEGTRFASVLDPKIYKVCNSRHHQAVDPIDSLPACVRVNALSPVDGVVEGIEVIGRRWIFGVQWHPEHARDHEIRALFAPLFDAFVEAALAS